MSTDAPVTTSQLAALSRAIRFALVVILLGLCYLNLRSALSLHAFELIFADMLAGEPLPGLTRFVLGFATPLLVLSLAVPLCAILTLFMKGMARPFYILGVPAFIAFVEIALFYHALFAPLRSIIEGMQNPG